MVTGKLLNSCPKETLKCPMTQKIDKSLFMDAGAICENGFESGCGTPLPFYRESNALCDLTAKMAKHLIKKEPFD